MSVKTPEPHKLSNQALGSIMMALQESLLNELETEEGLIVKNPPTVRVTNEQPITEQDLKDMVK